MAGGADFLTPLASTTPSISQTPRNDRNVESDNML
jgi:hypothetical protein